MSRQAIKRTCPVCHGSGKPTGDKSTAEILSGYCGKCGGSGEVTDYIDIPEQKSSGYSSGGGSGCGEVGLFLVIVLGIVLFAVIMYWGIASIAIALIMAPIKLYEKGNKYGVAYWVFTIVLLFAIFSSPIVTTRNDSTMFTGIAISVFVWLIPLVNEKARVGFSGLIYEFFSRAWNLIVIPFKFIGSLMPKA